MSITEIASTGLLRVIALPSSDTTSRAELPDWTARALALSSLQGVAGVPAGHVDLPAQSVPAPVPRRRTGGRPRGGKGSGDYRATARAHALGRGVGGATTPGDDDEAPSTFTSLL